MNPRRLAAALGCVALLATALTAAAASPAGGAPGISASRVAARPWLNTSEPISRRVDQLLARMTLAEKVTLMYGHAKPTSVHSVGYVPGITRLGIPATRYSDGPVGVHDSCYGVKDPNTCTLRPSTAMPATVSLAASFDPSLARRYGTTVGAEARARNVDVVYGPGVNLARVPVGGRNFEYFGEDPYLTGRLASAWVKGLQSQDVAAQVKHFVLNDEENDRHTTSSDASERTMRELYLLPFQRVVQSGADSLMCANNAANGTYNCENTAYLRDVLSAEWNWDGVVGSDYAATRDALGSVNGGLDQSFNGHDWGKYYRDLPNLVNQGEVSEQVIDDHVRRILTLMFRIGAFDPNRSTGHVSIHGDGRVARTVAERGTVLLRNQKSMLPLNPTSTQSVAVIGQYADTALTGGLGSSYVDPYYSVSPVQGIENRLPDAHVTTADGSDVDAAANLAQQAQVAVVVVNDVEQEGTDRTSLALPGDQDALVSAVVAANPNTIVVLDTGGPVLMPWLSTVPAVVEAWYPGEEDGNALAAVLFGDVDPAGHLPETFPRTETQDCCHTAPRYPARNGQYVYSEGLDMGYRWYDAKHQKPLFPFGFGLSYTTFHLSHLRLSRTAIGHGAALHVQVTVTNTGSRTGTAVPQLYLGFPAGAHEPPHRLVGTSTVTLAPGRSRTVSMTVPAPSLSLWDTAAHNWDEARGAYTLSAGFSSRSLPLHKAFRVSDADGAQGISASAPSTIASGGSATVRVTLSNTSAEVLQSPHLQLTLPHGWTSTTRQAPSRIPAHAGRAFVFVVHAPAGAGPGTYVLGGHARWNGSAPGTADIAVTLQATA